EETTSEPPLETTVLLATPPEETVSVPLLSTVATVTPRSACVPPLSTMVLLAMPPELTISRPPLSVAPISLPDTSSVPPLLTVLAIAVPPDRTSSVPPLRTSTPPLVWPAETTRTWPLVTETGLTTVTSTPPLPSDVRTNCTPA